jgi:hypothetical protein
VGLLGKVLAGDVSVGLIGKGLGGHVWEKPGLDGHVLEGSRVLWKGSRYGALGGHIWPGPE